MIPQEPEARGRIPRCRGSVSGRRAGHFTTRCPPDHWPVRTPGAGRRSERRLTMIMSPPKCPPWRWRRSRSNRTRHRSADLALLIMMEKGRNDAMPSPRSHHRRSTSRRRAAGRSHRRDPYLQVVDERGSFGLRCASTCTNAPPRLGGAFAESFSVQHAEVSKLAKAEPHRRLRHCNVLQREDSPHLVQSEISEVAIRTCSKQGAEGSRQSTFVDVGDAAQIGHVRILFRIGTCDLFETSDQLSIALSPRVCHERASILSSRFFCNTFLIPLMCVTVFDLAQSDPQGRVWRETEQTRNMPS